MNIFLNITCLSLAVHSKKSISPIFSSPCMNYMAFFSLQNSIFRKLFSPIIQTQNFHNYFLIKSCQFTKITNSALIFESDVTFENKIYRHQLSFEGNKQISISNCQFIKINLENENKSAITSYVPLIIDNTMFSEIKGQNGSCICINSSLSLVYTTFQHNTGSIGGCLYIDSFSLHETIIRNSIFLKNAAKYSSLFYRKCLGDLIVHSCNISNSESTDCIGVFENIGSFFYMDFTLFEKCKAKVHYGGIILKEAQKISIKKSTFNEIEHHSNLGYTASAIFISNGKKNNQIIDSQFLNCSNSGSYTISIRDTLSLTVYNCLFSDHRSKSIHKNIYTTVIDCKFDVDFLVPKNFFKNEVGYAPNRTKVVKQSNVNMPNDYKLDRKRMNLMMKNIFIRFVISFVFAFIIASVINYFHVKLSHTLRSKSRRERL